MKTISILLLLLTGTFFLFGRETHSVSSVCNCSGDSWFEDRLHGVIADPNAKQNDVEAAIRSLGAVSEPALFWTKIANNSNYPQTHRAICAFQFFKRQTISGMSLLELGDKLNGGTWIDRNRIHQYAALSGYIPIEGNPSLHSMFLIQTPSKVAPGIFICIDGAIDRDDLSMVLQGKQPKKAVKHLRILDMWPRFGQRGLS